MYFTRILLSIVFVLFASTALAAKPDKTLICHVGSELGSEGETYMDNPDCTIPDGWEGNYNCPDAGKIDLVLVSNKAKHNDNHTFGGISDYAPLKADVGDDPADFEDNSSTPDGIDDGCETEALLTCPCWDNFTETSLAVAMSAESATRALCSVSTLESVAMDQADSMPVMVAANIASNVPSCILKLTTGNTGVLTVTRPVAAMCVAEATAVIPLITWCP